VIGPPAGPSLVLSSRVRSGEIASQLEPWSRERKTTLAPAYITFGSLGEKSSGKFHWKRYLSSAAPQPIGLSGHGFTSRDSLVRWFCMVRKPPYEPPKTTSGSLGSATM